MSETDLENELEFFLNNQKKKPHFNLSAFGDEIAADLDEQLDVLEEEGIRFLEVRGVWGKNILDLSNAELDKLNDTLQARGFGVSAIGSPIGKISITEPFEPHLTRFERALEVADWLGTSYIRIFSFFIPKEEGQAAFAKYRPEVMRRLNTFAAMTTPYGMILLHENEKDIYGDIAERCADLLNEVGSTNLRAAFDPANFVQVGEKPFTDAFPLLNSQINHLHIKDAKFADGSVTVAGSGDGEVKEVIRALWQGGYQGYATLEPHLQAAGRFGGFTGAQLFHEAVTAIRQILAEVEAEES